MPSLSKLIGIVWAGSLIGAQPAAGQVRCPLVDIESAIEDVAAQTADLPASERVAAYRAKIIDQHKAAYAPSVFGMQDATRFEHGLDRAIERSLPNASDPSRPIALREFLSSLDTVEANFRRSLPKFRCNFPIYAMDSLGSFDGAGRIVDGRPALVIGIDRLVAERGMISLPVFLTHELFHRYHYKQAGFSDDPGENQPIWRTLWAEGLATYMSYRLTPGATIEDALVLPRDMAARADPQLPKLAIEILAHLDQVDHKSFQFFFTYGDGDGPAPSVPWRVGYYVGFLVARDIGRNHSLAKLPGLKGEPLRTAIAASLRRLSSQH